MSKSISDMFETGFLRRPLAEQIAHCDAHELAPLFVRLFRDRQPVLEAGCGSGQWCAWLLEKGIRCDGLDWSQDLCERAARETPGCRFFAGDMRRTGLPAASYGGVMALGSVEHAPEGPGAALAEFHRLLRPGGVAVITVPHGCPLRFFVRALYGPFRFIKSRAWVRRLFGKRVGPVRLRDAKRSVNPAWHPRFSHGAEGWFFYEYTFTSAQMRAFLEQAGFRILEERVAFGNEGILHTFGRLAGTWNPACADVDFTAAGRLLRRWLPVPAMGHMLCYVVEKERGLA